MSDIQDYAVKHARYLQQQVQQRHILALMGIEPWMQIDAPTLAISSIERRTTAEPAPLIVLQTAATQSNPVFMNTKADINKESIEKIKTDIHKESIENSNTNTIATSAPFQSAPPITRHRLNESSQITPVQRQCQQRQILTMMGIEHWVQPESPTLNIVDIETANLPPPALLQQTQTDNIETDLTINTDAHLISHINTTLSIHKLDTDTPRNLSSDMMADTLYVEAISSLVHEQQPVIKDMPFISEDGLLPASIDNMAILDKVAPFDLQGGRFGNWILLVDIQALNNDSQILWKNITQALSLTCETLSFPICSGEDAPYLANASLAGYIFRLSGMSEMLQVAALTSLPEGLEHPNLISLPTLSDMLADSQLKRQLWQKLTS